MLKKTISIPIPIFVVLLLIIGAALYFVVRTVAQQKIPRGGFGRNEVVNPPCQRIDPEAPFYDENCFVFGGLTVDDPASEEDMPDLIRPETREIASGLLYNAFGALGSTAPGLRWLSYFDGTGAGKLFADASSVIATTELLIGDIDGNNIPVHWRYGIQQRANITGDDRPILIGEGDPNSNEFDITDTLPGQYLRLIICQDQENPGDYTLDWPNNIRWSGGSLPPVYTSAPGACDLYTFILTGDNFILGAAIQNLSIP